MVANEYECEAKTMIYVTLAVSLFLFVYLFAALIRPEWF